jgi:hypothetical protein
MDFQITKEIPQKKKRAGAADLSWASPNLAACPWLRLAKAVCHHPI